MKQSKSALSNSLEDQQKKLLGFERNKYDIHIRQRLTDRKAEGGKLISCTSRSLMQLYLKTEN